MDGVEKRSLSAWFHHLWQDILFPGRASSPEEPWPGKFFLLLFLLAGILLLPAMNFPLFEPDETRYAEIPREMLASNEWVVPLLGGEPYLDKPPLYYWLTMLSFQSFGVGPWQARLVPVLVTLLGLLTAMELGRRITGNRAAFLAGLLLLLSPGYLLMGRLMVLDGLLSGCVTLALLSGFLALKTETLSTRWWLFSSLATGFGLLAKGPIAIVLTAGPLFLGGLIDKRLARPTRWQWLAWLVGATALSLPWYILIGLKQPGFFLYFLWEHQVLRFLEPFDHQRGVFFYLPVLLFGMLPLTCLLWPWLKHLACPEEKQRESRRVETGFLLLAGGWCVLFFSLSGCKLATYILPAFVPLALACGQFLDQSGLTRSRPWQRAGLALFTFLILGHTLALPWYANYRSPLAAEAVVRQWCPDAGQTVRCFPRESNAFAFTLARQDLKHFRSKDFDSFRADLLSRPRTVVLCTHRHALEGLKQLLPEHLTVTHEYRVALPALGPLPVEIEKKVTKWLGETALGLCDVAVIEKKVGGIEKTISLKPPGR